MTPQIQNDILFNLRRAEGVVPCGTAVSFILSLEDLYYALYARIVMEMANVELCSTFNIDVRRLNIVKDTFVLPHPEQLYRLLVRFKTVLDSPEVCSVLDMRAVKERQAEIIRRAAQKVTDIASSSNDVLGYRQFILSIVSDKDSAFRQKWAALSHIYQMPSDEVLMVWSEKYLTIMPKPMAQWDIPSSDLPFINPKNVDPDAWERDIITAHRAATLAKLEGKSVGEVRRRDDHCSQRLISFVKEKKCICLSSCTCSSTCTNDAERLCPCSEAMIRLLLSQNRKRPGDKPFWLRCASLARAIFEGFSATRVDVADAEMTTEVECAIQLFEHEIEIERRTPVY